MNRRPKLTIVAPNASPEEAAAVVAALERFMRATAPSPVPPVAAQNPWQVGLSATVAPGLGHHAGAGAQRDPVALEHT